MAVEVGQIAQGTVIRLLPYGILVRLDEGTTGLVHISEIDQNYVRDVSDYVQVNDPVTVKIIATGEKGKTELSMKQARGENDPPLVPRVREVQEEVSSEDAPPPPPSSSSRREQRASFEEKMRDFMGDSAERLSDLRRHQDSKLGKGKNR
ncbi:MAG TPA: S1 RNA-binding domain-containing protein [Abditibacteriaceae bacterium]|jgi:S1 RNA binding domain protein